MFSGSLHESTDNAGRDHARHAMLGDMPGAQRARYAVRPAGPDAWSDVVAVMDTPGDPRRCWCQWFHLRGKDWDIPTADKRGRLEEEVTRDSRPPGVLAYADDRPVGWARVGPKSAYARILAGTVSRAPADEPDPDGVWAVVCFVVPTAERGKGVATALLNGAVAFARAHGAAVLEGYPVDTDERAASASSLYHGALSTFLRAGFVEVRRRTPSRPVVRLDL